MRTIETGHFYASIAFAGQGTAYNLWFTTTGTGADFGWNGTGAYNSAVCNFPGHGGLCTYVTH